MIPKRENASSKLSGAKLLTEASATMASAGRQQRSVRALERQMARRHPRQPRDRPGRRASSAQEPLCRRRSRCRVCPRPAGAPPRPTVRSLERQPHDPFARTGRPTPAWRRCSKIRSAPRSPARLGVCHRGFLGLLSPHSPDSRRVRDQNRFFQQREQWGNSATRAVEAFKAAC